MKTTSLLILPCVLILVVGVGVTKFRSYEREKTRQYYSQPFEPELKLEHGEVPGYSLPGLFEVKASCIGKGGTAHSRWWVRAALMTNDGKAPREIWNSQKLLVQGSVSPIMSGIGGNLSGREAISKSGHPIPSVTSISNWRFRRYQDKHGNPAKETANLKMIVEAVAIPVTVPEEEFGGIGISVTEVTPAQIALARQQSDTQYFRESIELKAQDDSKHFFSRDAMK